MRPDQIDRLAEFCRLADKGYTRDTLGWCQWDGDHLCEAFDPFESDDDCRMVLEECRRQNMLDQVNDVLWTRWYDDPSITASRGCWLLLATPAEKCEAVLKVLGEQA